MNRGELDSFLRERTLLEEEILRLSVSKNPGSKDWTPFKSFWDENSIKKHPFITKQWNTEYLLNVEKSFNNKQILHPGHKCTSFHRACP